jgi:hypothetical protein
MLLLGRLVAPMTMTCARPLSPSMSVSSWETMRLSTSPWVLSLFGRDGVDLVDEDDGRGAFFSASSNAFLRLLSLSPASLGMISGPFMQKKKAPVSLATARAIKVLPEPGGP